DGLLELHDGELRTARGAVELPLLEVELRRAYLGARERDLVLHPFGIEIDGAGVLEDRQVPVLERLFLLRLAKRVGAGAGGQGNRGEQDRPEPLVHHAIDLSKNGIRSWFTG